jgi:hypothetical protein
MKDHFAMPALMPDGAVKNVGRQSSLKRARQPRVLSDSRRDDRSSPCSNTSDLTVLVTGDKPIV